MEGPQIGAALEKLSQTYASQPERARVRYSPAIATLAGGLMCRIAGPGGTDEIKTDMPVAMGGSASDPNPAWIFRASLASCCATVIAMRAARLGINLLTLEVAVEGDGDTRGILGLDDRISAGMFEVRTTVRITADNAGSERLEELVRWSVKHSPVAATVREAPRNMLVVRIMEGSGSTFDGVVGPGR